jgi:hypothetical protein
LNSWIPEHLISKTANTPSASRLDHSVLDPVPLDGGEAPLSQRETADSESLGARRGGRGVACPGDFLGFGLGKFKISSPVKTVSYQ